MASADATVDSVLVRLLDASHRQTLQQWRFEAASNISIGRATDREIVIPDGRISRLHAVLERRDNQWWLVSHGQNGVQVDGETVAELQLEHGTKFRLGNQGPVLQFCIPIPQSESVMNTLVPCDDDEPPIHLDSNKLAAEVREIVDGDFFQTLLEKSQEFRKGAADGK